LLRANPADAAFDLKVTKPRIGAWGPEDLARFLEIIEGHKYSRTFELIAMSGMRRGEALGIPWSAVDLDAGTITIEQTLIRDGDNGVGISPTPKSEESRRVIELDADLVALLRTQRRDQLERRMVLGDGWIGSGLVFDRGDGHWIDPDTFSQTFARVVTRTGLPSIPLKGLRHTIATIMIEAGESIKLVQEMLGHADAATTMNVYSHVRSGQQARATADVRKRIRG
jgi:integrase